MKQKRSIIPLFGTLFLLLVIMGSLEQDVIDHILLPMGLFAIGIFLVYYLTENR